MAAVEFLWWVVGWWGRGVGGGGLQSHFCVQPNHCVEVVLRCVVVAVAVVTNRIGSLLNISCETY